MKWTPQRIECNLSPALIYSQVTVLVPVARIILQSCTVTPVKLVSFRRGYFTNNQVGEIRRDRTRCYLQCTRRGNMPPNNGALLIFSQELRAVFIHSKNYHRHCSDMPRRPAATAGTQRQQAVQHPPDFSFACCMPRTPAGKRQCTAAGDDCPTKGLAMANNKPYLIFVVVVVDSD